MRRLLREIKDIDTTAAEVLQCADLVTDSDILLLTREELHELFPGSKNIKLRRAIFDIIHKQKPVEQLLREGNEFIPDGFSRAALTDDRVLVSYCRMLKDMKTQMNEMQSFLDAHIRVLDEFRQNLPDQESASSDPVMLHNCNFPQGSNTSTSSSSDAVKANNDQTSVHRQGERALTYQMVVGGETFGVHEQLMEKVKSQIHIRLHESKDDHKINLVFCPISSRVGSDIEAAMSDVKDDKPVILVLMHHMREAKYMPDMKTWPVTNVVLVVNIFYHETKKGLIKCDQNNTAVSMIQKELMERSVPISTDNIGNALCRTSSTASKSCISA